MRTKLFVSLLASFSLVIAAWAQDSENPLLKSIRTQEPVILKHGAHDTSDMQFQLSDSIRRGTSFEIDGNVVQIRDRAHFVNAHCHRCYAVAGEHFPFEDEPERLHPALLMDEIRHSRVFLKCDYKCDRSIEPFAYLSQVIPKNQRVGHAFVLELNAPGSDMSECCTDELLTFEQVRRIREIQGPEVPFIVSCTGLTYENLDYKVIDKLARKAAGNAEFFNFNLPDKGNPPVRYAAYIWEEYGLVPEIHIHTKADRDYWVQQPFPWVGLTDDPELATVLIERD